MKFHKEDADAILRIPLSRRFVADSIFWLFNRDGDYSVKSGYKVACKIRKEASMQGESSMAGDSQLVWRKIWQMHIPNKIKVFVWRACHGILPTRANLLQKHVVEDSTCVLCKCTSETELHVLWECGVAQDIWARSMRKLQKGKGSQLDFLQLVEELMVKLSREELELFFVQAWLIWTQRNTVTFGGVIQDPSRLVKRAGEYLEEFKMSQVQLAVSTVRARSSRWIPPPCLSYKLNFDAAIFQDGEASGFGVVIRNNGGEVMAALSARGPAVSDSEEAEVLACRKALEFAADSGFTELILEGDNSVVMNAISSSRMFQSRLGHLYFDVNCLAMGLPVLSLSCVARSANSVAHSLARFAQCINEDMIWLEESPHPALEALYFDAH